MALNEEFDTGNWQSTNSISALTLSSEMMAIWWPIWFPTVNFTAARQPQEMNPGINGSFYLLACWLGFLAEAGMLDLVKKMQNSTDIQ